MKKILALQNIGCEDLGTMEPAIKSRGMEYHYKHLYDNDKAPGSLNGYSGLIILGGPMNVYETRQFPYLDDEEKLIKEAIEKDIPTLGICLGAQLIAKVAGAKVFSGKEKEIGWYSLSLTTDGQNDTLFTGIKNDIDVFQWHGDTFELPQGAKRLAQSQLFPNQAFKLHKKIIGLQFHLEITEKAVNNWMEEYIEELMDLKNYIDMEKIKIDTSEKIDILKRVAGIFYTNFFGMI